MELALLGSILIGIALAVGLYAGQTLLARGFAFIESDFRDKLRRLRRPTKNLRTLLVCWAGAVLGVSLVMWVGLGLPVLGVLTAIVL